MIDVGVSAKVDVKTEIPSASSGRAIDAVVDFFRPATESMGWLGDKIQLARQKTLNKIATATKRRIELISKPVRLPPPKLLIPLIERASLEDASDEKLIEMWANLIATACTEEVEMLGQYATILSNLTSSQVNIVEEILYLKDEDRCDAGMLVDAYWMLSQSGLPGIIKHISRTEDIDEFGASLENELIRMGVALDTINIFYSDGQAKRNSCGLSITGKLRPDQRFYDYENLVRLGILAKCEVKGHYVGIFDIDVIYYVITPVGIDLYACCNPTKLVREPRQITGENSSAVDKTRKRKTPRAER